MDKVHRRLPPEQLKAMILRQLIPGRVICLTCMFPDVIKDKFMVLAALEPRCVLLTINSQIHPWYFTRHLEHLHHKLHSADYAFLDHDSYINCTEIYTSLNREEIITQLVTEPSRVKDELLMCDRLSIVEMTALSRQIAPIDKEIIRAAFSPQP